MTAGSDSEMVSRPPSISRVTLTLSPSTSTLLAKVACGRSASAASIWPVRLASSSMACLPRMMSEGCSLSTSAFKSLVTASGCSASRGPESSCSYQLVNQSVEAASGPRLRGELLQRIAQHRLEQRPHLLRNVRAVVERRLLVHVEVLAHLELDGMHALLRPAEVPRDVAALEAAVDDLREAAAGAFDAAERDREDVGRAALAVVGAEVQVRQLALEESREHGCDRVRFPEQNLTVNRTKPIELRTQRIVVWLPVRLAAPFDLRRVGLATGAVQRLAAEGLGRAEAGRGLARIQADAVRRAVDIDCIARQPRAEHRGAHVPRETIERFEMPVGVAQHEADVAESGPDFGRQLGSAMRNRDQQRDAAAVKMENVGIHASVKKKLRAG